MRKKRFFIHFCIIFIIVALTYVPKVYGISPAGNQIYQGIDVSNWQGRINFNAVKKAGIEIVYIKASEGTNYIDPRFRINYENAKREGLKVGFYHYVRARTEAQAIREAQHFANVIQGTVPDCRLAMDFETFGNLNSQQINQISFAFLREVEKLTGKKMVVYSNTYTARTRFSQELANQYPLWVAQYGRENPTDNGKWSNWVGFQYTDTGVVNGIQGYVDRNRFTNQILLKDTSEVPGENIPPEEGEINVLYTVKRGDTLSQIARTYGVTVSEIVNKNGIQNPNLIYVGQTLVIPRQNANSLITYTVKKGDTLSQIARTYGVTVNEIVNKNRIRNANLIYIGQTLVIPRQNTNSLITYIVKKGDTLSQIAKDYGVSVNEIASQNKIKNPNLIFPGQKLMIQTKQISRASSIKEQDVVYECGHLIHTIRKGETLLGIAKKYKNDPYYIIQMNGITNPNLIYEGKKIRLKVVE